MDNSDMNKTSPRTKMKFPQSDLLLMYQLMKEAIKLNPKLPTQMIANKNSLTLVLRTNPASICTPVAKLAAEIFGRDVYTHKHLKDNCNCLYHKIVIAENIRVKIYLNGKTCWKKGVGYTQCLDQNGRRTMGIDSCEDKEKICGQTPDQTNAIVKVE